MAIKITRWSPDTCDCILEYSWDSEEDQSVRKHSFASVVKKCRFHDSLEGKSHFDEVLKENRTKNVVIHDIIVNNFEEFTKEVTDPEGRKTRVIDESKVRYGFDQDRNFVVTLVGSDLVRRQQVKGFLDVEIVKQAEVLNKENIRIE